MKNGICPRCNGAEVYSQPGSIRQSELITLKPGIVSKGTPPDRFICVSCGYVEFFLANEEDLQVVRDTWQRVNRQS